MWHGRRMTMETMGHGTKVCEVVGISLIICIQKCRLNLLKFQKIFVEI